MDRSGKSPGGPGGRISLPLPSQLHFRAPACNAPPHVVPCSSSYSTAGGAAGSSTEASVPWPFLRFSFSVGGRKGRGKKGDEGPGRRHAGYRQCAPNYARLLYRKRSR